MESKASHRVLSVLVSVIDSGILLTNIKMRKTQLMKLVSFISFFNVIPCLSFTSILNRCHVKSLRKCIRCFHQIHDDLNTGLSPSLPNWATAAMKPPDDIILDCLYLGDDEFVSVEIENDSDMPQEFYVDVVYQDPTSSPKFYVDPQMGVIEPNGGQTLLTVMPILDEDEQVSSKPRTATCHSDVWLVVVTASDRWYYKLESTP
jgi:hypothetical protein